MRADESNTSGRRGSLLSNSSSTSSSPPRSWWRRGLGRGGIICLFPLAYLLQSHLPLEGDVGYLIHAASQLLHGGSYAQNFFETNPPLILYLYMPVLLITHFTPLDTATAVRLYVLALIALSLIVIDRCNVPQSILLALAILLLFLPVGVFAQREHLLIILTMPYWLSVVPAKAGTHSANGIISATSRMGSHLRGNDTCTRILISILAGIGFALKPFFYGPFILIELYLLITTRNLFSSLRLETIVIASIAILYTISIFIFQPDYLQIILPLVNRYYFSGSAEPWAVAFSRPFFVYCLVVAGVFPFIYKNYNHRSLATILFLVLLGFIVAILIPRTAWYYHVLPALTLACLLVVLLASEVASSAMVMILLSCFFLAVPTFQAVKIFMFQASTENRWLQLIKSSFYKQDVYCIPTHHLCTWLSINAGSQYVSRFPSFWELRGLLKFPSGTLQWKMDEINFINRVATDVQRTMPALIIFDGNVQVGQLKGAKDYIAYFSRDPLFKASWKHYRYLQTVDGYELYVRL